jgi:hypothetical protein
MKISVFMKIKKKISFLFIENRLIKIQFSEILKK